MRPLLLLLLVTACSGDDGDGGDGGDNEEAVASITVTGPGELAVGGSANFTAEARDAGGTVLSDVRFTWGSDRPDVATVDDDGTVRALVPGSASISASAGGERGSARLTVAVREPTSTGTIAYTRGGELRLIEPDGSGDHLVWETPAVPDQPDLAYTISAIDWRPDGRELAFASDHEQAGSVYERDVYGIGPDGEGLRRITNPPMEEHLASYPQGQVAVRLTNLSADFGPFFVYVQGASELQMVATLGPGDTTELLFEEVADFGDVVQPVAAIFGGYRWADTAVDVQAGASVDGGVVSLSSSSAVWGYGADAPFWRRDGERLGFIGPLCLVLQTESYASPGYDFDPLVDPDEESTCLGDWGASADTETELLLVSGSFDDVGRSYVYIASEDGGTLGEAVATLSDYTRPLGIRWLPDGSGFLIAAQDRTEIGDGVYVATDQSNLYELRFEDGSVTPLTALENEFVRRFTISPDLHWVVFERVSGGTVWDVDTAPSDLWIVRRDGTEAPRLLVEDAGNPDWNPAR